MRSRIGREEDRAFLGRLRPSKDISSNLLFKCKAVNGLSVFFHHLVLPVNGQVIDNKKESFQTHS